MPSTTSLLVPNAWNRRSAAETGLLDAGGVSGANSSSLSSLSSSAREAQDTGRVAAGDESEWGSPGAGDEPEWGAAGAVGGRLEAAAASGAGAKGAVEVVDVVPSLVRSAWDTLLP